MLNVYLEWLHCILSNRGQQNIWLANALSDIELKKEMSSFCALETCQHLGDGGGARAGPGEDWCVQLAFITFLGFPCVSWFFTNVSPCLSGSCVQPTWALHVFSIHH